MAINITVISEAGNFYAVAAGHGHPLGASLAEMRQLFKDELNALPQHDRRAIIRAVAKRLLASGIDPQTATLAQMKTAVESSAVDV